MPLGPIKEKVEDLVVCSLSLGVVFLKFLRSLITGRKVFSLIILRSHLEPFGIALFGGKAALSTEVTQLSPER